MNDNIYLVVTSIAGPNDILQQLSKGCGEHKWDFVLIGDEASPVDFDLEGCDFYSLERQRQLGFEYAKKCPARHYARKNIGYLLAMASGASIITETDDDNIPLDGFWTQRNRQLKTAVCEEPGWVNVYKYFSEQNVWPRGFVLDELTKGIPPYENLEVKDCDCPIQQNLADENPDVDAVYRLILPLPVNFKSGRSVAMSNQTWCPFNSQNTTWWPDAYKLLYLPAYCSFRMTDIWRSFVAQRIAWENNWLIYFGEPTMRQERNEHNLMRDFSDEVPGYLNNKSICDELSKLNLQSGIDNIGDNLKKCYQKLIEMSLVGIEELELLNAWLSDIAKI